MYGQLPMTSDIPVTSDEQRSVAYSMTKLGRQLVAGLGEPSPSRRHPDKDRNSC